MLIAAAQRFGCRGWGVDLDPELIVRAGAASQKAGTDTLLEWSCGDLFALAPQRIGTTRPAAVVLYLLPAALQQAAGLLMDALVGGAVVVTLRWPVPGWEEHQHSLLLGGSSTAGPQHLGGAGDAGAAGEEEDGFGAVFVFRVHAQKRSATRETTPTHSADND